MVASLAVGNCVDPRCGRLVVVTSDGTAFLDGRFEDAPVWAFALQGTTTSTFDGDMDFDFDSDSVYILHFLENWTGVREPVLPPALVPEPAANSALVIARLFGLPWCRRLS